MILTKRLLLLSISIVTLIAAIFILDKAAPLNLNKLTDNVTVVSDVNGRPLRAFANPEGIWRYRVTAKDVSPYYLEALFNYEDRHFYQHPGVNPFSMLRAVGQAIYYGKAISGGSTITMQVARLLHPNRRTVSGKIYQILRALQLEWHFSKDEILDMYLNIAPFGGPIEGIQTASYVYFDKPASKLTRNEAALLAVLPQSPSRYRPDRFPQRAKKARNKLLNRLATFDVWPQDTVDTLLTDPVYADYFSHPTIAPLLSRRLMTEKKNSSSNIQFKNALTNRDIHTFIDGDVQEQLEYQLKNYMHNLPAAASAAVMVMDAKTGKVKAYLGSADFNNNQRAGHVDMIKAIRSPGSTLKPFVYADAIEQGLIHEQSLLHDTPVIKGHYRPTNFNGGYSGPVSMSDALLRSLNLPVLQVLNYSSVNVLAARLNNGGLTLHWPQNASPNKALVLGGVGAKLEDLVSAYSALINNGQAIKPRYTKNSPFVSRFLLEPESAWIIQNVLRQQKEPGRISEQLSPHANNNIGWKTGTSYGFRDAWVIGFSGSHIIGTWIGRPDSVPLTANTGTNNALPLFLQVAQYFDIPFIPNKPNTVNQYEICWPSGLKISQTSSDNCISKKTAWLDDGNSPATLTSMSPNFANKLKINYYLEPDGTRANILCATAKAKATSLDLWPPALNSWIRFDLRNNKRLPASSPKCHNQVVNFSSLEIISIKPDSHFIRRNNEKLRIPLVVNQPKNQVSWFLNGELLIKTNELVLIDSGKYQLLALDKNGRIDQLNFYVQ